MNRQGDHTAVWRLIDTGPLSGRENMAIDEALFRCFDPASSRPILRLYGWQPPALSLGRFQKAGDDLDLARCAADNLAVVRRITGGGAIFHADELTYSLVCSPSQIPAATSIKDSFRILTSFLLGFYSVLGLQADYAVDLAPAGSRLGGAPRSVLPAGRATTSWSTIENWGAMPSAARGRSSFSTVQSRCRIGYNRA